ncbi:hypothetical protein D7V97_32225 [Corallococcus sp. CA053C]|uniref:M12 family metallopeptidase n=1 Tax=Corallococcus sp. CA053C TaxID=2316732 RepID=UPI000EA0F134|nr:M12 family metallopeptidase [Corallococcus sp. CA053C]RKG99037.1 hypothetical protein D7V97_32225 [Corallococcus sp. CA053C]
MFRSALVCIPIALALLHCSSAELSPHSGPEGEVGWFQTPQGVRKLEYQRVNGMALVEGDVLLDMKTQFLGDDDGIAQNAAALASLANPASSSWRWPGGVIPYRIDPALPDPQRVYNAINHWNALTVIKLVPHSGQPYSLTFLPGDPSTGACFGSLGHSTSAGIWLIAGCGTAEVIHEIGHVVGLWHEQNRHDRDQHINIHWGNIDSRYPSAFALYSSGSDVGAYDTASIMHYDSYAFSINGQPTITRKDGSLIIRAQVLSPGDINGVALSYEGNAPSLAISSPAPESHHSGPFSFSGVATDDLRLGRVRMIVQPYYGQTFDTAQQVFNLSARIDPAGWPDGRYELWVEATDWVGNSSSTPRQAIYVDRTAPVVTMSSPSGWPLHGWHQGSLSLSALAYDANLVDVQLFVKSTAIGGQPLLIGTSANGNLTVNWDSRAVADSGYPYQVYAVARDKAGTATQSTVSTIVIDNHAPTVAAMTAPLPGSSVGRYVRLEANVQDNIERVRFYLRQTGGDVLLGEATDPSVAWGIEWLVPNSLPNGSTVSVYAVGTDKLGRGITSPVSTFTVNGPLVAVEVTSPAEDGMQFYPEETVSLEAVVFGAPVTAVEFEVPGMVLLQAENTGVKFQASLELMQFLHGDYEVITRAYLAGGDTLTASRWIHVKR